MPDYKVLSKELNSDLYSDVSKAPETMSRRKSLGDISKYVAGLLGAVALGGIIVSTTACNPKSTTKPPITNYVKIIASGSATETLSGSPLSGNVRFVGSAYELDTSNKPYLKSFDVEVPFGTQTNLGMVPEGSSASFEMDFSANDALNRIFKAVSMNGTRDFQTDMLKVSGFNYPGMRQYITGYGTIPEYVTNRRWNVDHVDVSFNPDNWSGGTGERLSDDYKTQIKTAILNVVTDSGGFIKSYSFADANNPEDTTVPPDGQTWVSAYTNQQGVSSPTWPIGGDQVKSARLLINPKSSMAGQAALEVYNLFMQGVNDTFTVPAVDNWYKYLFKRGIDTKFYGDREEQNSFSGTSNLLARDVVRLTQDKTPDIDIIPSFGSRETKYRADVTHIPENVRIRK